MSSRLFFVLMLCVCQGAFAATTIKSADGALMKDGIRIYGSYGGSNTVLSGTCDPSSLSMNAISIRPKSMPAETYPRDAQNVSCVNGTWSTAYSGYGSVGSIAHVGDALATEAVYTVRIYPCVTDVMGCSTPSESYDVILHSDPFKISGTLGGNSANRKIDIAVDSGWVPAGTSLVYLVAAYAGKFYSIVNNGQSTGSAVCSDNGTYSVTGGLCFPYVVVPFGSSTAAGKDFLLSCTGSPGANMKCSAQVSLNLGPMPALGISFYAAVGSSASEAIANRRYVKLLDY